MFNSLFLVSFSGSLLNGSPALASSLAAYLNFVFCCGVPEAPRPVGIGALVRFVRQDGGVRRGDGGGLVAALADERISGARGDSLGRRQYWR